MFDDMVGDLPDVPGLSVTKVTAHPRHKTDKNKRKRVVSYVMQVVPYRTPPLTASSPGRP